MRRPELVILDVGGVLFPSSMPRLLHSMSRVSPRSERNLRRYFNHQLREDLWSGRMDLPTFWDRLLAYAEIDGTPDPWSARMEEILTPLPSVGHIAGWAGRVPLGILSNHRHEWVLPALERCGALRHFDPGRVLVSSRTGRVKPYPDAFRSLGGLGVPADRVLLVDDRYTNVTAARRAGLQVILADVDGAWPERLNALLESPSPLSGASEPAQAGPPGPSRTAALAATAAGDAPARAAVARPRPPAPAGRPATGVGRPGAVPGTSARAPAG